MLPSIGGEEITFNKQQDTTNIIFNLVIFTKEAQRVSNQTSTI